jgi:hypothetical protein
VLNFKTTALSGAVVERRRFKKEMDGCGTEAQDRGPGTRDPLLVLERLAAFILNLENKK